MKYNLSYKKGWFTKKYTVVGHNYDPSQDKMILFFEDGSLKEVCEWKKCEIKLGPDWVLAKKKMMEAETGVDVKMNIGG
jgi:hypothetical protein